MASETTSIVMPENFSMNETFNGSPSTNFSEGKNLNPIRGDEMVIVAVPISYRFPDYMNVESSRSSLKVIDVQFTTYVSCATPVASPPQGRKKRDLKESVVVGSYDFNFELKEEQRRSHIKIIDEMTLEENRHITSRHLMTLPQRLHGWKYEARRRNKTSIIDKIYIHKYTNARFRSFSGVENFVHHEIYPSKRKRVISAESQDIITENKMINTSVYQKNEEDKAVYPLK